MSELKFSFQGGDADNNQLDFYDASRFLYGASRFIYHLEYFRQTGDVGGQVRRKNINILLNPTKKGSFVFDIIAAAGPILTDCAIKAPLENLFAYAWSQILPQSSSKKEILSDATVNKALEVANKSLVLADKAMDSQREAHEERVKQLEQSITTRMQLIEPYRKEFYAISSNSRNKLLSKIRPAAIEMGKPLEYSADKLLIGDKKTSLVFLDKFTTEALKGQVVSETSVSLLGSIIQYNTETGWGKFRNNEVGKVSFRVPSQIKKDWSLRIIDLMKLSEDVIIFFYTVSDSTGNLSHLVFDGIYEEDDLR